MATPKPRRATPSARWRAWLRVGTLAALGGTLAFVAISNVWVLLVAHPRTYDAVERVPTNAVGLVLGTSKQLTSGQPNGYFQHRIEAAAALYHAGKVSHLIVSGDNRTRYYNEPADMRDALVQAGVSADDITLDYAGLRTFDSVVRCKEIFGQERVTVVSQAFHTPRAVFIGRGHGMDVVAFNARLPTHARWRTRARELLARCAAVADVYLLDATPRHLGEKEPLEL